MKRTVVLMLALAACGGGDKRASSPTTTTSASATPPVLVATAPPAPADGGDAASSGSVSVPAGTFAMGSKDGSSNERPVHQVHVAAFRLDRIEVTVSAYDECVSKGACSAARTGAYCNEGNADRANHPINCVDWGQASAYCGSAGKRLPTEEEWEYAAGGADGRTYPWGNAEPEGRICWRREMSAEGTCPVGSFADDNSPFGAADMAGNVSEWTSSGYGADYGSERSSTDHVFRGGSWRARVADRLRSASRDEGPSSSGFNQIGFRCAR
jgi:formylglycine-generating enzyme required for sulfatase activity